MSVSTKLTYTYDDGQRPHLYARARTYKDKHKTDYSELNELVSVSIRNGRNEGLTLDQHGFELTTHSTTMRTADFYNKNESEIKSDYYGEIADMVKERTGAAYVHCFHHQVRNGDVSSAKSQKQYASDVHTDSSASDSENTFWDALQEMEKLNVDVAPFKQGRYLYINAWRNISDVNKIQDNHLALCDETSLIKPDDYIPYDFFSDGYHGAHYNLSSRHSDLHRWYYFPEMSKDEVILFKQFDSDPTRSARMCFHASFQDTTAPPDAPQRESIEVRCMAFFPDHTPNTCPSPDGAIRVLCSSVFLQLEYLHMLPYMTKWRLVDLMKKKGWEEVLDELIKDKDNIVGIKKASHEKKERIRAMAIAQGFEQHCQRVAASEE